MTPAELYHLEKAKRIAKTEPEIAAAKVQFQEFMDRWKLDRSARTPANHPLRPMSGRKRKR